MAIINCPECGTQVSDKASQCPKCAYPFHPSIRERNPLMKSELLSFVLTFLFGTLGLFYASVEKAVTMLIISLLAFFILIAKFVHDISNGARIVYDISYYIGYSKSILYDEILIFSVIAIIRTISIILGISSVRKYNASLTDE